MHFLNELKEGLIISYRAVKANKMRSVLTTLGIVIGIVSVTLMSTAIEGVNRAFDRSAAAFGTDVLYVQRFPWVGNEDWALIRNRRRIEAEYATRIERQAMLSDYVAPGAATRRRVYRGNESVEDAFVSGTTHQYMNAAGARWWTGGFTRRRRQAPARRETRQPPDPLPHEDPMGRIRWQNTPSRSSVVDTGRMFVACLLQNRVFIPFSFESNYGGSQDVHEYAWQM